MGNVQVRVFCTGSFSGSLEIQWRLAARDSGLTEAPAECCFPGPGPSPGARITSLPQAGDFEMVGHPLRGFATRRAGPVLRERKRQFGS